MRLSLLGIILSFSSLIAISDFLYFGVDIIAKNRAGIYDVSVVRSDNADDLISWLNDNEFQFGDEDKAAFEDHIARGWCFVVAKVNPTEQQKGYEIITEGLVAPLLLRFPCEKPIYPVALTGTGGHNTEILLYLASERKMSAEGRLTLRFAEKFNKSNLMKRLAREVDPPEFFANDNR